MAEFSLTNMGASAAALGLVSGNPDIAAVIGEMGALWKPQQAVSPMRVSSGSARPLPGQESAGARRSNFPSMNFKMRDSVGSSAMRSTAAVEKPRAMSWRAWAAGMPRAWR
jgi:hypothetical protein